MRRKSIVIVAPIFLMIMLMGVGYGEAQFESDLVFIGERTGRGPLR